MIVWQCNYIPATMLILIYINSIIKENKPLLWFPVHIVVRSQWIPHLLECWDIDCTMTLIPNMPKTFFILGTESERSTVLIK